jgi:hypothetical protein
MLPVSLRVLLLATLLHLEEVLLLRFERVLVLLSSVPHSVHVVLRLIWILSSLRLPRLTRTSSRQGDAGIQGIIPSIPTLLCRSTRNQCGSFGPILAIVRLYCILQLAVFVFCPFTLASTRPVDAVLQDAMPPATTLYFRPIWNQRDNCLPILATDRLYCILQLAVFDC